MDLVLFHLDISAEMHLSQEIRFCGEIKFHDDYSLLLEKHHAPPVMLNWLTDKCFETDVSYARSQILMMRPLLPFSDRNLNEPFCFKGNQDYHADVRDF
ncbi:hypothetical protein TNCV_4925641 [Trichonephila clavipes]|nr:hypothetical protein TNCV_4925641 [Trichonephila clavipes]